MASVVGIRFGILAKPIYFKNLQHVLGVVSSEKTTVSLSTWHMQYQGLRPRRPRRHRRPRGVWKKATPRGLRWCTWPSFWPRIWRTWCSQDRRVAGWQDDSLMFMQVIGLHQIQQQTRNHNQPLAKNQLQHAATTCKAIQQQDLEFIRASA